MKKIILIAIFVLAFMGCDVTPSTCALIYPPVESETITYNDKTIKEKLLELNPDVPDFTVTISHEDRKQNAKLGFYNFETKRITLYTQGLDDRVFMRLAIHEFAHHVHQWEQGGRIQGGSQHSDRFCAIMSRLLIAAEEEGLDV